MKMQGYNGSQLWDTAFAVQVKQTALLLAACWAAHARVARKRGPREHMPSCPSPLLCCRLNPPTSPPTAGPGRHGAVPRVWRLPETGARVH